MQPTSKATKGFQFKQFAIGAGCSGMPVSTDGVMLGAWAKATNANTLLDIGTGTGLLALMIAQRNTHAQITALDIEPNAISDASDNFKRSPWSERLNAVHSDVLAWQSDTLFDHIICNPPYFTSGETATNQSRAMARHTFTLDHQALLSRCSALLKPQGRASFVLPKVEGDQFIKLANRQHLFVTRYCQVRTTERKECTRLLFELAKQEHICQKSELVIHQDGRYSDSFIELTRDFYLKM
ncbi:methyltransferase [Vibrio sp. SCSIO 43136]|uniref:tRNA1(Val) (adenine(37)-N6)-methyltransferase n=1 Tax=Vibrio sp. SCSIO 43136 TaxID=2819101 RepID=UPI002076456E|nr:methyltransferase [Vibrio sp. SCSIO 43136]USD65738.1 methyltransferase [Vibrio sp. SCSIO 43136]